MPTHASTPDDSLGSVAELLQRRAAQRPDQTAFVFLADARAGGEASQVAWTYAELDRKARNVAAAVARAAAPGERAALVFPPGLDFLAAFFGCLYAGVLPAPATYPKPRRPSSRLDAIIADCAPRIGLTTAETRASMDLAGQSPAVRALPWIAVDQCAEAADFACRVRRRDDPAFLQYTSGSTSDPRGVVVTHGNLLHNLELIREGFRIPSSDEGHRPAAVFWLPAYHDMGLIGGILSPLYVGGVSYLLAPATFLQRPMAWLETLSRTGATLSGAPNFAYDLCARKSTPQERAALDLSRWRLAFCGAEPIDAATLEKFAAAFAPAGFRSSAFYPCYGLAESTLMVSGGDGAGPLRVVHADRGKLAANQLSDAGSSAPGTQPVVSCGRSLGDQDVRIVDPKSLRTCRDGAIGEIWVRGESVAAGYWNHPEEQMKTFAARLADGGGPFLRTGDLGAMLGGELFVTGRSKDVIIVRGRNIYPQDVERTAEQAHEAVDGGAAFSVIRDGQERLIVVHQAKREHRRADMAPVAAAIRTAVIEQHDVDPHAIVLLRPGALPLTSSGKVQRSRCRELFEAGALEGLHQWTNPGESAGNLAERSSPARPEFLDRLGNVSVDELSLEIQQWMLDWLSDRVEIGAAELTPTAPFTSLGMDSLTALELNVEFETVLGVRLPPAAAWSYPTPSALSRYLAETLLRVSTDGGPRGGEGESWLAAMEADVRQQ
jgi:acyl-CoA synthetase (AMP-forming)/AMP-acid ligase II/acyl carrier protein